MQKPTNPILSLERPSRNPLARAVARLLTAALVTTSVPVPARAVPQDTSAKRDVNVPVSRPEPVPAPVARHRASAATASPVAPRLASRAEADSEGPADFRG